MTNDEILARLDREFEETDRTARGLLLGVALGAVLWIAVLALMYRALT